MKLPDFSVDVRYGGRPSVHWQDADRRYHFWLDARGRPADDVLHSNPIVPSKTYGRGEHRALKQSTKKWSDIVAAIVQKIEAEGMVAAAVAAEAERQKTDAEKRQHEIDMDRLRRLTVALAKLPKDVRTAVEMLPPQVRTSFVFDIEST